MPPVRMLIRISVSLVISDQVMIRSTSRAVHAIAHALLELIQVVQLVLIALILAQLVQILSNVILVIRLWQINSFWGQIV